MYYFMCDKVFFRKSYLTKFPLNGGGLLATHTQHGRLDNHIIEPVHEISNNLVCATSKASDQPAHSRSLIRAFACRLSIL